jgi:hypothetical protein
MVTTHRVGRERIRTRVKVVDEMSLRKSMLNIEPREPRIKQKMGETGRNASPNRGKFIDFLKK